MVYAHNIWYECLKDLNHILWNYRVLQQPLLSQTILFEMLLMLFCYLMRERFIANSHQIQIKIGSCHSTIWDDPY